MPLEWVGSSEGAPKDFGASLHADGDPPLARLHLWPHRSLPKSGFVIFIGATFAMILLPLVAVVGTPVLWGLLPFMLAALLLVWVMLQKSYRDGEVLEELVLWSDFARLSRQARNRPPQIWEANPHWISVHLHKTGGPVPNYLTLRGAGREVEIGAFLSEDERIALKEPLEDAIRAAARSANPVTAR